MMKKILLVSALALTLNACIEPAVRQTNAVLYKATDTGPGGKVGEVTFTDTKQGLKIETNLYGLSAGKHGFHVHEHPSCEPLNKEHAMAAGGHYDPDKTGKHLEPDGGGHKGDLPVLTVEKDGTTKQVFYVKNVKAKDFRNRSVMIHAGGDNYKDTPKPLGGGGARIACGIID